MARPDETSPSAAPGEGPVPGSATLNPPRSIEPRLRPVGLRSLLFGDDTSPEAEAFLIEGYRRMSPAARLQRACEMGRAVQQLALARIRGLHPDAGERELQLRLASLWLDRGTMIRAFAWDPDVEGY